MCSMFLDLKKAFDTVPHQSLMEKLVRLNLNPFILQCSVLMALLYRTISSPEDFNTQSGVDAVH